MDFFELELRLAAALDVSLYELHHRSRSLREETTAAAKKAMEARAARKRDDAALAAKRAITISGREAAALLAGFDAALSLPSYRSNRKGPGSGLRVDAALASSFLISLLIGGPHRGIARRTLDMSFACYAPPPNCSDPLCPMTGQRTFVDALTAVLTDRKVFDRGVAVSVSDDRGIAQITFEADRELVSKFMIPGAKPYKRFFREAVLVIRDLPWLFDAVNDAPVRAKELA